MENIQKVDDNNSFFDDPIIKENFAFLKKIGVIEHINSLNLEIHNYKNLLVKGLNIFNHTSIDKIMDATVYQLFDQFLPSFIAFLWKPIQTREDITIKAYKNYKPAEINLHVHCISPFESFFRQYPNPINFELLAYQINNDEAVKPYLDINTEIAIPILGPFGLYGIILVGKKNHNEEYNRNELFFLQQLMSFVSQAIKNHLHYEYSLRDVKTGLYNHGFFLMRLSEEITRVKRKNYRSSIAVIDVDNFKIFNDNYGHLAGDKVLEHIAKVINNSVREDDTPARFGGEEFTILLPNTDNTSALGVAERLRNNVAKMEVPWHVPLPQVTISIGIYTFDQNTSVNISGIIHRADEALYISKGSGRNRSTVWNPEIIKICPNENFSIGEFMISDHTLEVL